jgi:uncharacterized membrane protein (DUF2068 family)
VARPTAVKKPWKKQAGKEPFSAVLFLIGLFKLFKAVLLLAVGIGAIRYLHKDLSSAALHWAEVLRADPGNRIVHGILVRIFRVTPKQLRELSVGTFIYAGLFATEGIGLLLRKHWAEYFVIVTTGLLIPLEVYELARHFTITKLVVTVINVLIVWYLVVRVRSRSKRSS